MKIEEMTDEDVALELDRLQDAFSDFDFVLLERELRLRAAVLGWTGDPLKQPSRAVLVAARAVKKKEWL